MTGVPGVDKVGIPAFPACSHDIRGRGWHVTGIGPRGLGFSLQLQFPEYES